jgi:hypothetical protein
MRPRIRLPPSRNQMIGEQVFERVARPSDTGSGGIHTGLSSCKPRQAILVLSCAVGPEWITKVIEFGSSRWKPHHYQLMKQKLKRPYLLKATQDERSRMKWSVHKSPAGTRGIVRFPLLRFVMEEKGVTTFLWPDQSENGATRYLRPK